MIFSFRSHIINEKKVKIKELVETTWTILSAYNDQVERGEISLSEAKKRTIQITSKLRYGSEMKDYYWITDMHPHQLMHPYHKVPYGYDLSDYVDSHDNRLFVEFRDLVKKSGSGYHTYYFQWKDNPKKIVPKISYVKGFKPWGWIVGTGIYIEEVNADIYTFSLKILLACFLIFIIIVFLSIVILNREANVEQNRKEAVEALRENEEMLKNITNSARDAIIEIDPDGCISFWNPAAERLTGYSKTEAMGKKLHALLMPSEYKDRHTKGFREFQKTGKGRAIGKTTQWNTNTKSGELIPVELSLSRPVKTGDGWRTVGILRDISERKEAERALRESEEMFKALAEKSQDVIIRYNPLSEQTYANPAFMKLTGIQLDDILYKTHAQLADKFPHLGFTPELIKLWNDSIQKTFERGQSMRIEFDFRGLTFDWILIPEKSHEGEVVSVMTSARDITELKLLHQKLNQAHKMEAIGTLSGGIAHDFNNILSPIIMGTEMVLAKTDDKNPDKGILRKVIQAAIRAKELVQQILNFSRHDDEEKRSMRLIPIIKETLTLIRATLPSSIEIKQNIIAEDDIIWGNPIQIHQVIMNLCTNAFHAMKEKGGILEIEITNEIIDTKEVAQSNDLKPENFIKLFIKDTGHGMSAETIDNIYDPFFTTKARGEGTGMGLSVVHGIIKSHDGFIHVESAVDKGTTFHILIPCKKKEFSEKKEDILQPPFGSERILFIDDEEAIINIYSRAITKLGYKVDTRTDALGAMELLQKDPYLYDLVITDQTMPKLTGAELSKKILEIRKNMPIILCTGFSEKITPKNFQQLGIRGLLMKPIAQLEMAQAIRKVLDSSTKQD